MRRLRAISERYWVAMHATLIKTLLCIGDALAWQGLLSSHLHDCAQASPSQCHSWQGNETWVAYEAFSAALHAPPLHVLLGCESWQVQHPHNACMSCSCGLRARGARSFSRGAHVSLCCHEAGVEAGLPQPAARQQGGAGGAGAGAATRSWRAATALHIHLLPGACRCRALQGTASAPRVQPCASVLVTMRCCAQQVRQGLHACGVQGCWMTVGLRSGDYSV